MYYLKLIIWVILFPAAFAVNNLKMIIDIANSLENAPNLLLRICWGKDTQVQFARKLSSIKYYKFLQIVEHSGKAIKTLKADQNKFLVAVDTSCLGTDYFLKNMCENNLLGPPLRWILFGKNNLTIDSLLPEDCNVFVDSEILLVEKAYYNDNLYEANFIYRLCRACDWQKEIYGYWSTKLNSFERLKDFEPISSLRRLNLNGHEIKICYVMTNNDSYQHLTDRINGHIDSITKSNFVTTNNLLDFLNASRKYMYADTWGYRQNNSWTGMSGYLDRGEVDIGGSPMFFRSERLSFVEYISCPTPTLSKFVFRQPNLSYENNLYLLSFKKSLWYGIAGLLVLLFCVLCLVTFWEKNEIDANSDEQISNAGILRPNVFDIGLFIFGAVCQQGSSVELKGALGRVVLLLLFGAIIFFYTSFTANIVALLQSSSSGIKTLEDLLNSRIKFGIEDTVYNRYYFSQETEPIRKAIYEKKVAPPGVKPNFMSMEDGVKEMKKGLFAFHMETGVGYKFVGKYFDEGEKCGLKEISYLRVIDPWLAVKKCTPYLEMLKIGTKRLQEHGLQQRENHLFYEKRPKCSGKQATFVSVRMVDCYPAIMVFTYGILIAVILALMEILYAKRNNGIKKMQHKLRRI